MQQFDLSVWLQDKSRKVVTRNGIEAEIIHDKYPLVAIINSVAYNFDNDGKFKSNKSEHRYDLFFADENKELTEFEEVIYQHICTTVTACDGKVYGDKELKPIVKGIAKELIDLARKEILKDLPKWKKTEETMGLPDGDGVVKIDEDGKIICMDVVWEGEYFITLQSLKFLPKEE